MPRSHSSSLDVVTCGEAMALFAALQPGPLEHCGQFQKITAGAELNVAIGLARLGFGVGYLSRVGNDSIGRFLLAALDHEGIDRSHVALDEVYPTGLMFKTRSDDGSDPHVEYFRRGSAASRLSLADYAADYCLQGRHVHLTGISAALSDSARELTVHLAREARAAGKTVSFDPNLRPRLWSSTQAMIDGTHALAALGDLVMPGLGEGRLLTGYTEPADIARFYLDLGASAVVIKLGPAGAYFTNGTESGRVAGVPVPASRVVDTVGAGDGFAVGVISGLLDGLTLAHAVERGTLIGARVVQFMGDCEGLPTRAELEGVVL
ncbi:sugar kinase [Pararobbsia alpina]|uniref:2-dehydro-3-deoxygluconokinase n=1 Tax=Pararobbsia alpina TaxID=621374 RepID=A0A6S7B2R6_9BURK|nr:sugar kinase [Pararobbsia alpina]CAB3785227.1 2-dehydro-3-deoxygluconokinase [Pararobbsia alpina]